MPTEAVETVLNRDLSRVAAKKEIATATALLTELVNEGTRVFKRCEASSSGDLADTPLLMLYLHMLEMVDGIQVLVAESCVAPAIPLVRSAYEACLSIEYILESESERRALSWLAAHALSGVQVNERFDGTTAEGKRYQTPLLEQGLASQTETITEMRCDHVIHNELAIIAAHRRNFPAALVHALHMDRAWLDDRSREGVGPGTDAASLAREVARSDQVMAMVYGVTAGMLDALARGQDVFEHLDELREAVGDVEDLVPDEAYWSLVFRELRSGFSRFATVRSIEEQLSALGGDHLLLRALLSLAVSFCAEAKPPLILAHQAVAFEYLTSLRKYETKILRDITEFLRRFWDGHARRDLVGAPDVLAQVTLLVSTTTTPSRAAALLLRLGQAMNAPIPVALQRRLAELASPGSEI